MPCVRACSYGLIGPNGCGKSTLLTILGRHMVEIPESIDVFHLVSECEVGSPLRGWRGCAAFVFAGAHTPRSCPGTPQPSEMTALEAVLAVDEERRKLEDEVERLGDMMGTIDDMDVRWAVCSARAPAPFSWCGVHRLYGGRMGTRADESCVHAPLPPTTGGWCAERPRVRDLRAPGRDGRCDG